MPVDEKQKAINAPPRVTAVVVRNAMFEAQIGEDRMVINRIGPQGGRQKEIILTGAEAGALIDLVAHGRATLEGMRGHDA